MILLGSTLRCTKGCGLCILPPTRLRPSPRGVELTPDKNIRYALRIECAIFDTRKTADLSAKNSEKQMKTKTRKNTFDSLCASPRYDNNLHIPSNKTINSKCAPESRSRASSRTVVIRHRPNMRKSPGTQFGRIIRNRGPFRREKMTNLAEETVLGVGRVPY